MMALRRLLTARTTPWIQDGDRTWSGPEVLAHPLPVSDRPHGAGLWLIRVDASLPVTLARLLAVPPGDVPLLWPARVPEPLWLSRLLADRPAVRRLLDGLDRHSGDGAAFVGVCSSGTSGSGKIAVLDVGTALANASASATRLELGPGRLVVSLRSPAYSAGFVGDVLASLVSGARLCVPPVSVPEFAARGLAAMSPADLHCSAAVAERVAKAIPSTTRRLVLSGDLLPAGLAASLRKSLPSTELWTAYGLSEAGPRVAVGRLEPGHPTGTLPEPLPGIRVTVEDGEIVVNTPYAASALLGPSGIGVTGVSAVRTGDLGTVLPGGRIRVRGRRGSAFRVGGQWVVADEIVAELAGEGIEARVVRNPSGWTLEAVPATGRDSEDIRRAVLRCFPFLPRPTITFGAASVLNDAGKRVSR